MSKLVRNILAVIAGFVLGSVANMAVITIGPLLIAPPAGVDASNAESIARSMHLFEPRHFVMPFLAHAFGTVVGALAAFFIAGSHKAKFAWAIGVLFLCGGIAATFMIPAPAWFIALDLLVAYLPMAWLAIFVGNSILPTKGGAPVP